LQLNQIDVALAALSVTPEREAVVDFSNVYYVGEDAILARQDSPISSIGAVTDMASQTVGVQRGSTYEDWLRTSLVDTGQMPPGNLLSYENAEDAIRDLREQRVALVVWDALPAQSFANQGDVKMVGRGLNQQRFALAMRKGATSLKAEIDRALTQLQNEGKIAQLAQQYLNLDPTQLLPTPTPTPAPAATNTPGPPPACIDGMAHVRHLTWDGKNLTAPPEMAPGQAFEKGWRVRNTGTCTWDGSYSLAYAGGNVPSASMGGKSVAIVGTVPNNAEHDIKVNLVAPFAPGVYQGFWEMRNGQGVPFGERVWVGIKVPAPATATPAPTQTPSPGISFSADRTRIKAGERVVLTWKVENVKAVYLYAQGERWEKNGVAGEGRREVWPVTTTIYELRVVHRDNRVEIRQIRIEVEPVVGAPIINRFTVNPAFEIVVGQCVDIQWEVQGPVSKVKLLRNNVALWDGAPTSGTLQDCPPGAGEMEYAIEASGPGGTSRLQRHVNVVQPVEPTSPSASVPATPVPEPPVIDAFAVNPNQIQVNECVNVSWSVGGGATLIQIKRNGVVVLDNAPFSGEGQECHSESGTVTYRVEASNSAGQTVFKEETITVEQAVPPSPVLVIHSFTVSADEIALGECVVLSWEFEGTDLALVRVFRGEDVILTDPPNMGTHQDCPPAAGQVIYRLVLDAEDGTSAQKSQMVNVVELQAVPLPEPPPEPPSEPPPEPPPEEPTPEPPPEPPPEAPPSEPTPEPSS
jgi:hypothetical protein